MMGRTRKTDEFKLFVYGTLKSGHSNNRWYLNNARFLGTDTVDGFELRDLGGFPAAIPNHNSAVPVRGEVWLVTGEELMEIDVLEGFPDFYQRSVVPLGRNGEAIMYYLPDDKLVAKAPVVENGCWTR